MVLKKYGIWIALALVAIASIWAGGLDDEAGDTRAAQARSAKSATPRKPVAAQSRFNDATQRDPAAALALIAQGFAPRAGMDMMRRDPFAVASFEPPPPPAPPPPKPTAPPLKFKYLGVLDEDSAARAVFLDNDGQMLIARKGDTLAGQYLVLEITDTQMQLEYTPLAQRQTLSFGR